MIMEHSGIILTGENGSTLVKTCFGALYTTNLAWTDVRANPVLSGERPFTNRSTHGTAHLKTKINLAYIARLVWLAQ